MSKSILVIGASGQVGAEIVRLLKAQGHKVRATTSKKIEPGIVNGVEQVHLDVLTGEGLSRAFEGIQRVFLMSPGGYADHHAVVSPMVQEAKRRGVEKVVLMTAMGVDAVETSPFRRVEIELEKSGLAYNIIRPNWFMQNFNSFWVHGIKTQGKILLPAGSAKTSFIDARDISEVAAKLLVDDHWNNQALVLTGPEALSHDEVANVISEGIGKKVVYEEIEPEVLKRGLVGAGLDKNYVEFLLVILGALKAGYNASTTANVKTILGHEPRSFQDYVRDFKAALS